MAEHRLNVQEGCPPVRQKKRGQAPERNKAIQEEMEKLVDVGIMKEVHYHSWLSNPVMEIDWKVDDLVRADTHNKEGMFLGYKVNADGLKVCPDKADAVLSLPSMGCLKDRKQAAGKVLPDGLSCIDGSGAGLILTNLEGVEFTYAMRFRFEATNNETGYEALIAGLRIAKQMGVKNLQENVDSRLVANQVNGSYVAKELGMVQYLEKVKAHANNFREFSIKQVPRSENKKEDALSRIASTSFAHLSKQVLVEKLKEKSIHEKEVLTIVEEEGRTWMTPICEYLTKEILPKDKKKARAVHRKASRYTMVNGTLYKKSFLGPCSGIDIAGPFPEGPGKVKFLIVAIDYFTKWIEAKPVATITGNQCFASMKHPQANGLVERANRSLGEGVKARLDKRSKDWIGELSHVLWAHRIMIKSRIRETPFSLTYGMGIPTLRTAEIDLMKNDEALEKNLDLIEEKENKQQFKRQKEKLRWKSTTTIKSAAQASGRGTWSAIAMMQATPRTEENLDLNGKDHMKSRSH
ncbi:reverse transcriptase domain-containing protein [Tanacetum coccineum]